MEGTRTLSFATFSHPAKKADSSSTSTGEKARQTLSGALEIGFWGRRLPLYSCIEFSRMAHGIATQCRGRIKNEAHGISSHPNRSDFDRA
jgi:hypothetical protein